MSGEREAMQQMSLAALQFSSMHFNYLVTRLPKTSQFFIICGTVVEL